MRALAALLLAVPTLSLSAGPTAAELAPGTPWPAGDLRESELRLGALLVHVEPAKAAKAPAALARLAPRHLPGFPIVKLGKDQELQAGKLSWTTGEEQWREDELQYFARQVEPAARARLTAKNPVTVVMLRGPAAGTKTLRAFTALVGALGADLGAVIYDLDTRELWSPAVWSKHRVTDGFSGELPVVDHHIAIHSYRTGDAIRSVTLGMSKLGLPDVVVESGQTMSNANERLVEAVCQWMAERGAVPAPGQIPLELAKLAPTSLRASLLEDPGRGATGSANVTVAVGRPDQGDAPNRLMELTFQGFPGDLGERQMALLRQVFGAHDKVSGASSDDRELLEASRRAKAALHRFRQGFEKRGLGEQFLVKLPFRDGDHTEYMWVEVRTWRGSALEGVLQDEPFMLQNVRRGARVKLGEAEIYDWVILRSDGTSEGGETSKILERREGR